MRRLRGKVCLLFFYEFLPVGWGKEARRAMRMLAGFL